MEEKPTPPESPSLSSQRERDRALAAVLQGAGSAEGWRLPPGPPRRGVTTVRLALAALLTAVAMWLWILPPAFLSPSPPPALTQERAEAALRVGMALQAERILEHRIRARRLPDFLREVGDTLPGIRYTRLDAGTFSLEGSSGGLTLVYRSDQSLDDFLGDAVRRMGGAP